MIAVNGTPLDQLPNKDPIKSFIEQGIAAIKRRDFWIIDFHPRLIKKPEPGQPGGYRETAAGIDFKATSKYMFEGMDYDITYFQQTREGKFQQKIFTPRYLTFGERMSMSSKKEADKIFFYLCVSKYCEEYPDLEKWQNKLHKLSYYKIDDPIADAMSDADLENKILEVRKIIYDDKTTSEEDLRVLASAYEVPGAFVDDINILRRNIKETILKLDKQNRYNIQLLDDFVFDAQAGSGKSIRETVKRAFDKGYIEVKMARKRASWYFIEENQYAQMICQIPLGADPQTSLLQHLVRSKIASEKFMAKVAEYDKEVREEKKVEKEEEKEVEVQDSEQTEKFEEPQADDIPEPEEEEVSQKKKSPRGKG